MNGTNLCAICGMDLKSVSTCEVCGVRGEMSEIIRGLKYALLAWMFIFLVAGISLVAYTCPIRLLSMPLGLISPALIVILWRQMDADK